MTTQSKPTRRELQERISELLLLQSDIVRFYAGASSSDADNLKIWIAERNAKTDALLTLIMSNM